MSRLKSYLNCEYIPVFLKCLPTDEELNIPEHRIALDHTTMNSDP